MTVHINQDFTGTNGSSPSNLMLGATPTGGSVAIQSNRVRFNSGTGGTSARLSRAATVDGSTPLSLVDVAVTVDYIPTTNHYYPGIVLRSITTAWDGSTGYIFETYNGTVYITKAVSSTYSTVASAPYSFTAGVSYKWYCEIKGSTLKFFVNDVLIVTGTDSTITAAGYVILTTNGLTGGASDVVEWDNLYIQDPITVPIAWVWV